MTAAYKYKRMFVTFDGFTMELLPNMSITAISNYVRELEAVYG